MDQSQLPPQVWNHSQTAAFGSDRKALFRFCHWVCMNYEQRKHPKFRIQYRKQARHMHKRNLKKIKTYNTWQYRPVTSAQLGHNHSLINMFRRLNWLHKPAASAHVGQTDLRCKDTGHSRSSRGNKDMKKIEPDSQKTELNSCCLSIREYQNGLKPSVLCCPRRRQWAPSSTATTGVGSPNPAKHRSVVVADVFS
jgi:hypothetical protein